MTDNNNQCVCDACGQLTFKHDNLYNPITDAYLCANCAWETMEIVDNIMTGRVAEGEEDIIVVDNRWFKRVAKARKKYIKKVKKLKEQNND